ncbi:MAG: hydroxyacid dehydrogenase [Phycisphaeraceae bacterium]
MRIVASQCGQGRTKYQYDRLLFDRLARTHRLWINPKDGFDLTVDDLREAIADADVLIAGWGSGVIPGEVYAEARALRLVCLIGSSIKPVSPEAAWERGVTITNTAPAIGQSVAEFVIGLMLRWLHPYERYDKSLKQGMPWQPARNQFLQRDLADVTVGLVGCGATVRHMAPVLKALGTKVLVYDPYVDPAQAPEGLTFVDDLITLMAESDIVSLHAGLTPQTRGMIGHTELSAMRDGALLINAARGGLIHEDALVEQLSARRIHAALDVFDPEPLAVDHRLRSMPNVTLTPHVAGTYNITLYERCCRIVSANIDALANGEPLTNIVTPEMYARMT